MFTLSKHASRNVEPVANKAFATPYWYEHGQLQQVITRPTDAWKKPQGFCDMTHLGFVIIRPEKHNHFMHQDDI